MARSKKAQAAIDGALSIDTATDTVGLGIDLVDINRMRRIIEKTPRFVDKYFSEDEIAYCKQHGDGAKGFAARFAAKEAAVKALGTGFSDGVGVRDIEVVNNEKGKPSLVLSGRAKEIADEMGIKEMALSMSHTENDAVACVIALTEKSKSIAEKKIDPLEELSKRFKETRGMLDNLGNKAKSENEAAPEVESVGEAETAIEADGEIASEIASEVELEVGTEETEA